MRGEFDGVGGPVRAHVHDHLLPLGRIRDRRLGHALALLHGLQQTLAGSAADVDAIHPGAVQALQQRLKRRLRKLLVGIERRDRRRQNSLQISRCWVHRVSIKLMSCLA